MFCVSIASTVSRAAFAGRVDGAAQANYASGTPGRERLLEGEPGCEKHCPIFGFADSLNRPPGQSKDQDHTVRQRGASQQKQR